MKTLLLSLLFVMTLWADAHIFVYHRFGDSRYPSTDTSKKELEKEFNYFKAHGYKVIPLEKLVFALKNKKSIPNNWIVLTIDDNFRSFYDNGLEIFKKFKYPFSLFVYVEATEKKYPDYLSWSQLREISKYGTLEFHSYAHPHMTKISDKDLKKDFKKGLTLFKQALHVKPKYFAYPYGEYSNRVKNIAKKFKFDAILNQNIGAVNNHSDIFDLDRNALVGKTNLKLSLKYKYLQAKWIKPTVFPKDGILRALHVKIKEDVKNAGLYISGKGWERIPVKNREINIVLNKKLTKKRTRIIISVRNKISTKLLLSNTNKGQIWN